MTADFEALDAVPRNISSMLVRSQVGVRNTLAEIVYQKSTALAHRSNFSCFITPSAV